MQQKLSITDIREVREPEPAVAEIVVSLQDDTIATLRMNIFTLQKLFTTVARSLLLGVLPNQP